MTQFTPSPEQQAIFDAVLTTKDNVAIAALAGTGKTTSLVELSRRLPAGGSRIFCAFNKDIVKELESRLNGTGVSARTFHSIGLGALKKYLNVQELPAQADKYKVLVEEWATDNGVLELALSDAVQSYAPEERGEKLYELRKATLAMFVNLLNFVRLKLVTWDDINALDDLVAENALDADMDYDGHNDAIMELVLSNVEKLMKQAESQTRKLIIDFTDMIYWAVKWNVRFFQYQWVLVDECQDLSPLQREMIAKILSPRGGRIILVGDPNQAIYAFAGADSNSFSLSVERWNCKVLPLTMTRRCDAIITLHSSRLVPSFRCPDDKPRGKVVWLPEDTLHKHARIGDMILSRVKAPLVKSCLSLIAEGIPATILGADIGKQLVAMLEKITKRKEYTFGRLLDELISYRDEQIEAALKKDDEARAEAIRDNCNALKFVVEAYPNATDIKMVNDKIAGLFADDKPSNHVVTLATIHKSKGLEAERVFILAPDKLPLRAKNMTPEQEQQEGNLDYVARTRAKHELVYMTNEKFLKYNTMPNYAQEDFEDKVWDKPVVIETVAPVVVEASTETFPSFQTVIGDVLGVIGTARGLYAPKGNVKMWVCRDETNTQLAINTCQPDGTKSTELVDTLAEALDLMKAFEPNPIVWQLLSMDEWHEIYTPPTPKPVVDTVFNPNGMFIEAFTPEPVANAITTPDDPYGQFQINITALLALISSGKGLFAVDGDTKMYVAPNIDKIGMFFLETVNGEYIQEAVTLTEALAKMYAFSPIPFTWNSISSNDWMFATASHKTMKERKAEAQSTPLVEASAPLPFASIMKQHLTELLTTYDPDRGLCADGKTTTMYITTDWDENYVIYERDYADEDDLRWSRDTKEKNTELVLKRMEALNPSPDAWRVVIWGDWIEGIHNASTDEQESPAPMVEPPAVIEASTEQPVVVDEPPTPSADALLVGLIAKCLAHPTSEAGDALARAIHTTTIPHLMGIDWENRHDVATMRIAIKRVMREYQYPPSWTKHDMNDVVDAIAYLFEHGKLPDAPAPDTRTPFAIAMTPRMRELVTGSKQGLFYNGDTTTLFIEIAPDESIVINEFIYAEGRNPVAVVNLEAALSSMESHNPNPDAWQLGDWDTWYKDARNREKELQAQKPNTTATPSIEAPQPIVSVEPVVAPVPDETPADITPTFSNGENSQPYQNGKDITPTPAPLPSTAPDVLKALIEHFRPFALPELDLVVQAIEYIKREKTEGATV